MTGSDTHADTLLRLVANLDAISAYDGMAAVHALVADHEREREAAANIKRDYDDVFGQLLRSHGELERERARADRAEAALREIEKEALIEGDMDIVNFVRAWLSVGRTDEKLMPANPDCPSCFGTGWATLRANGITVAGGPCVCRGGNVDAAAKPAIGREPTP